MRYRVRHTTTYESALPVTMGYHLAHLTPRDTPGQRVRSHELIISPAPSDRASHVDAFGNRFTYFCIEEPHEVFEVTALSEVEIINRRRFADPTIPWERAAERAASDPLLADFVVFSDYVHHDGRIAAWTRHSFPDGRPLLDAVGELNERIYREFTYDPGWTTVSTPVEQVFESRRGVCQDFAHLLLSCVRSLGIPARYVSGYVENRPPEGETALEGADASHAWVSVMSADGIWIDLDPTNGLTEPSSHVTVAWGRDYDDVVPLRGVVTSPGEPAEMSVAVVVERLEQRTPPRRQRVAR